MSKDILASGSTAAAPSLESVRPGIAPSCNTYASADEWRAEAVRRFGPDPMDWRFVCPSCGYEALVSDWKAVGAKEGEIAFSCIGRHMKTSREAFGEKGRGPCNYAGGGLFAINPVSIEGRKFNVFAFASKPILVEREQGGQAEKPNEANAK